MGTRVKLSQVASLVPVEGPREINRMNRVRQVTVGANRSGRPLGDVTDDIKQATEAGLPAGWIQDL